MFKRRMMPMLAALAALGMLTGCGEKPRNDAEKQFLSAAKKGDAEAQYNLGACYEFGGGAPRNVDAARRWYEKAAAQGHKKAAARLRHLNPPAAPAAEDMKKLRSAAQRGDAEALFQLAQCLEFGFHLPKDPDGALRYYKRAAKKGHEEAAKRAETMTEELAPDAATAKKYFASARRGNAEAQYQVARCLEFGFHVKPDPQAAGDWYRRAAKQGHPKAMERLNIKQTPPRRKNPPRRK